MCVKLPLGKGRRLDSWLTDPMQYLDISGIEASLDLPILFIVPISYKEDDNN